MREASSWCDHLHPTRLFEEGIKKGKEILSVDSRNLYKSTKCGGKFSKDFPTCTKFAEHAQAIITTNTQIFTWKPEREKSQERGRFYFNLKEVQADISGSVIRGALEFFVI